MKKLLFTLLAFISLTASAQIQRPIAGHIVYGGGGPTLTQTVNVKIDGSTTGPITGWNIWQDQTPNTTPFVNTASISTGFLLVDVNGYALNRVNYSATKGDVDFPDAVINRLVYTNPGNSKVMKLTGLDNSKTYTLIFCSFANDADASDNTNITVQGVTKYVAVDNNSEPFKTPFTGVVPVSGEISITVEGATFVKYGCFNAFILKEYSP